MSTRVAIVTGGGSGIGRALATRLVRGGDTVVVADLNGPMAETVAAELSAHGHGVASAAVVDVGDDAAVGELVAATAQRHGRLDLMVNNAGIAVGGPFDEVGVQQWRQTVQVNLLGVVHGAYHAYPLMKAQGFGHIVNTASIAGLIIPSMGGPYVATKHAVVALSLSLRAEAAPYGVRVTALCPGFVDTPLLDADARAIAKAMQGRLLAPEEFARRALRGIDRNRALVVTPPAARVLWWLQRISPQFIGRLTSRAAAGKR